MVTITTKESGLLDEIKILAERNIPYYEKVICPVNSFIRDRVCDPPVRKTITQLSKEENFPVFHEIGIETINRCNGKCSFCPVNQKTDPRTHKFMETELFKRIINQLQDIDYDGQICFNGNNEPLIDKRLEEFLVYTHNKVSRAHVIMYTNGMLLTVEKFKTIITYLDELFIDNYNNNRKINPHVKKILDYLEDNPEFSDRVRINITRTDAIRTTRAGLAKNRSKVYGLRSPCIYPFWQINIRSDGKVSLCCNDAIGSYTLGDTNTQTLQEIWNSKLYWEIRNNMLTGRHKINMCSKCDTFLIYPNFLYKLKNAIKEPLPNLKIASTNPIFQVIDRISCHRKIDNYLAYHKTPIDTDFDLPEKLDN